jgi:hypothetical protein
MKTFMLVITFIALIDAGITLYLINTLCPDEQIPLNIFFGTITALIKSRITITGGPNG